MTSNTPSDPLRGCDAIRELIPDYAFGLATAEDIRLVESNLADCPEAANDLADFRRLQEDMRASVVQIEPPAALGARLMSAIATPALPIKPRRQPIRWAWLAAALIAIAFLTSNIYWLIRVNDLTRQQSQLASNTAATAVQSQASAFVLNGTGDLHWVRLAPSQENEQNAEANAFLMWNGQSGIGLLYAHGFPKLDVGKTYEVWLTRGNEAVSAGTLKLDETGQGALLFHVSEPIDKYTWGGITIQPDIAGTAPSGIIVVGGKLKA